MAAGKKKSSIDRQIDENLKRVYDDALNQEVPEKFLSLIAKLKQNDVSGSGNGNGNSGDSR